MNDLKGEELKNILDVILSIWANYILPEFIYTFWEYVKNEEVFINIVKEWDQVVNYLEIINILIITRSPWKKKHSQLYRKINSLIKNEIKIKSPVNILIEDIYSFNEWVKEWRYFYLEIINNWVLLYNSWKFKIRKAKDISKEELREIQKEDFNSWFEIANEFFIDYKNAFLRESYRMAIFYLHQTVESLMTCYLLVKEWYKPKTHDLEVLYSKLKSHSKKFNNFFDLEKEDHYFYFLKDSYISSRYMKKYHVNKNVLLFIEERVCLLKDIVEKLCLIEITK